MIHVNVDNVLTVIGGGTDFYDFRLDMEKQLTWPNPDYIKKEKMGKWLGNTPRTLTLVQRKGDNAFVLPFGMLKSVPAPCTFEATPHISHREAVFEGFPLDNIRLYPYQKKAVNDALRAKQGILVAPCGSGKTQMGIAIFMALGLRCLWLTHTHELLKQSMNRLKSIWPEAKIGTITEGKVNAGEYITFATIQTMAKIDLEPLREFWDVIIVDECHKAVGTPTRMTMFWKVVSGLSARFKYGLTATPERGDGLHISMFALIGRECARITREQVRDTTVPLCVKSIDTYWAPDLSVYKPDGTLDYVGLINVCCSNDERNHLIANTIMEMNGPVLVLSERIAHLQRLSVLCDSKRCCVLSTASKKARNDAIKQINDGDADVLLATYQLAKEGLDIPCLRHLVIASPVKDEITVIQSAGRVMRKYPEKTVGIVWDFCDDTRMLRSWANKRLNIYRRLNDGN